MHVSASKCSTPSCPFAHDKTITLSEEQVMTLVDQLVEDRDSLEDYLRDGTFDDDQDQKEQAINDVYNINSILRQL